MTVLSPRERRLIALALLVAALALVWLVAIQPLLGGFADRAVQRELLRARHAANERLIAQVPALRRLAGEQAGRASGHALVAPDREEGGEALRRRLEESLSAAGGEQRASEVLEAEPGWVRAGIGAVISHQQMTEWLSRLRSEPPYLVLDHLTVNADRAMNANQLDLLDVRIEATVPLVLGRVPPAAPSSADHAAPAPRR